MFKKNINSISWKKELFKTTDSDESIARGCALQAAMLSPIFKVKEFQIMDTYDYPIDLAWGPVSSGQDAMEVEMEKSTTLIVPNNPLPSIKSIAFPDRTEPFQILARYSETQPPLFPSGINPLIGRWVISGISKPVDVSAPIPKIKVYVKLNQNGILNVTSGQQLEEYTVEEPIEESKANVTQVQQPQSPTPSSPTTPESVPMETESAEGKDKPKTRLKKKIRKLDLKVEAKDVGGLSQDRIKYFQEREVAMANQDRIIEETAYARNALESYVLETRNRLQDEKELGAYVTEQNRDSFIDFLNKAEEWLNDEGYDVQKSEYTSRLEKLRKLGDPIVARQREELLRPDRVSALKSAIGRYSNLANSQDEKYSHIENTEKEKISKMATETDEWLSYSLSKQDRALKHEEPVLTIKSLNDKLHALEMTCGPIINKPKPKPKEKPKKEKTTKKEETKEEPKQEQKKEEQKKEETKEEETKQGESESEPMKEDSPPTPEKTNVKKKKAKAQKSNSKSKLPPKGKAKKKAKTESNKNKEKNETQMDTS